MKFVYGTSPQSRSGGGGGIQTVGYDGSQLGGAVVVVVDVVDVGGGGCIGSRPRVLARKLAI